MKRGGFLPHRKWLNRRKRLRSGAPPVRRTPMRRSQLDPKPVRPAVPRDVRALVHDRAEGVCEVGLAQVCDWYGVEVHHRVTRKRGGRCSDEARAESDRLSDLLLACGLCHEAVHRAGRSAFYGGWRVHEGFDPAREPVLYRGDWRWLDDLGGVHDFEVGAA